MMKRAAVFFVLIFVFISAAGRAETSTRSGFVSINRGLRTIPVQDGGRVKPFESFAREIVLYVTGKTSFRKIPPSVLVWFWIADSGKWGNEPLLYISHPDLRKRFSADLKNNRIAPNLVLHDLDFSKEAMAFGARRQKKEKLAPLEEKAVELYDRARIFEAVSHGAMPGFIPHPSDPTVGWLPLEAIASDEGVSIMKGFFPPSNVESVENSFFYMLGRLKEGNLDLAVTSADAFRSDLQALLLSKDILIDRSKIQLELHYLGLKPFRLATIFYFGSIVLWALMRKKKPFSTVSIGLFVAAFAMHTYGFALRILIAGRPPVSNMYESVIWVAWGAVLFSGILWVFYRSPVEPTGLKGRAVHGSGRVGDRSHLIPGIAGFVAGIALIIGEALPAVLDPSIKPLAPVLRSNYWLTIHVLTITLGYAAFLLNWGVAHALLYSLAFKNSKRKTVSQLTEFLYRSLQIGLMFLSAGTILGGVWAADSWGRFWGWDPKETWALIAVLAYLAVLHARTAGWLDSFGVALWSAIGFLTVLMAWYGVNFVLAAGLHSYGFGGGGLHYVAAFILIDILFIAYCRKRFYSAIPSR